MRYTSWFKIFMLLFYLLPDSSYSGVAHYESSFIAISMAVKILQHFQNPLFLEYPLLKNNRVTPLPETAHNASPGSGECRKQLQIRLEKLLLEHDERGNGRPSLILCTICQRGYASTHTSCCHSPVCRACLLTNASRDACILCLQKKCYICLSFQPSVICARCCDQPICDNCLTSCTQRSTACPYCVQSICDTPAKTQRSVCCSVCNIWFEKDNFNGHQLAAHPTSKDWILDYQLCNQCDHYVHPQMEVVHQNFHSGSRIRNSRDQALARILQAAPIEDPAAELPDDDEGFEEEFSCDAVESEEVGETVQLEWMICPICQQQVMNDDLTEHMVAGNHILSEVETPWHEYCRRCRVFIRRDWYPVHHQME